MDEAAVRAALRYCALEEGSEAKLAGVQVRVLGRVDHRDVQDTSAVVDSLLKTATEKTELRKWILRYLKAPGHERIFT